MTRKFALACLISATVLGSAIALAEDTDADRSSAHAYVKDSTITTKIKAKLAEEHLTSVARIHVDTERHGIVRLSGHARSQEAIDKAGSIARETEGVKAVHNHIKVKKDD